MQFPDPEELQYYDVEERIELWGLQIPHNSVRPQLTEGEQVWVLWALWALWACKGFALVRQCRALGCWLHVQED
jgi:hypothetical protein